MTARRSRPDVRLRPVTEEDLEVFFENQLDPDGNAMGGFTPRGRDAFFEHWRTNVLGNDGVINRAVVVDGEVAGNIVCFEHDRRPEVGYWIGRPW